MSTVMVEMPVQSLQQRLDALERANVVRMQRKMLKAELKAGRVTVVAVLCDPPAFVATMKVCDLLLAAPKLGRVKVNKILGRCGVSPSKSVGGLTVRQRSVLAEWLR